MAKKEQGDALKKQIDIFTIAKHFARIDPITANKLNLLCFIAQGIWLSSKDELLIDEDFEAWAKVPTIRKISEKFPNGEEIISPDDINSDMNDIDEEVEELLDAVFECYGYLSESEIIKLFGIRVLLAQVRSQSSPGKNKRSKITKDQIITYAGTWL